jgi:hypothetical protein
MSNWMLEPQVKGLSRQDDFSCLGVEISTSFPSPPMCTFSNPITSPQLLVPRKHENLYRLKDWHSPG